MKYFWNSCSCYDPESDVQIYNNKKSIYIYICLCKSSNSNNSHGRRRKNIWYLLFYLSLINYTILLKIGLSERKSFKILIYKVEIIIIIINQAILKNNKLTDIDRFFFPFFDDTSCKIKNYMNFSFYILIFGTLYLWFQTFFR